MSSASSERLSLLFAAAGRGGKVALSLQGFAPMILKMLVCGGAVVLSVSAHAGTKPLYQPTPPWVVAAPTTDLGTVTAPPLLIFD